MKWITTKKYLPAGVAGFMLLVGSLALAQRPKENISPGRHPNLAAAQRLSQQAFEKITAAQEANEWDMQATRRRPRTCWMKSTGN